jgi:hypothetical protein
MLFLARRFLSPWWERRYVPSKRQFLQERHGVASQVMAFFIVTAVRTSVPAQELMQISMSASAEECGGLCWLWGLLFQARRVEVPSLGGTAQFPTASSLQAPHFIHFYMKCCIFSGVKLVLPNIVRHCSDTFKYHSLSFGVIHEALCCICCMH